MHTHTSGGAGIETMIWLVCFDRKVFANAADPGGEVGKIGVDRNKSTMFLIFSAALVPNIHETENPGARDLSTVKFSASYDTWPPSSPNAEKKR